MSGQMTIVRVMLPEADLARVREIVEALRARGTRGKNGEIIDEEGVVRLAVLLVYRMSREEVARLYDNVPAGPLAVWSASPPPRSRRPGGQ